MKTVLKVEGVKKRFLDNADNYVEVLLGCTFSVNREEIISIVGPSGEGKSTLLNILAGLSNADAGNIELNGYSYLNDSREVEKLISSMISYIQQTPKFIEQFSVLENMKLAARLFSRKVTEDKLIEILSLVSLDSCLHTKANSLSGGQRQRLAIALGLLKDADLFICDEPTGNLNEEASISIILLLRSLAHDFKKTVIIVTHDRNVYERTDRTLELRKGRISI